MMTSNPFLPLAAQLPGFALQGFVLLMLALVVAGTLIDVWHKGSGKYFARLWCTMLRRGKRRLGNGELARLAGQTLLHTVAGAGEFCNHQRRLSHLLLMYGFIVYVIATCVLVFAYPAIPVPAIWPLLWNLGVLMVLVGGWWFFLLIRVDVAYEGHSPWRLVQADLFIGSLLASTGFALLWEVLQAVGFAAASLVAFALYAVFTAVLFGTVPWSKLAHMFYKPAAAFQRRVEEASGASSLPLPAKTRGKERRIPCPPSLT
jgi:hypothetical protein